MRQDCVQLQFEGYAPQTFVLPLEESPFGGLDVDEANGVIRTTLMGDPDERGWINGTASGEEFRVREIPD